MQRLLRKHNIFYFVVLLSLLFLTCKESSLKYKSCEDLYLIFENNLEQASTLQDTLSSINSFQNLRQNDNECINLDLLVADIYYDITEYEKAKICYIDVLKKDSTNIYALFNLSLVYYNCSQYDTAIILLNKASLYKTKNGFAIDYNEKLDLVSPSYDVSYLKICYYLGLNYYYKRNYKLGLANFSYCISNNFNLKETYLYVGAIYFENNMIDKACINFRLAKKLGNPEAEQYLQKNCSP